MAASEYVGELVAAGVAADHRHPCTCAPSSEPGGLRVFGYQIDRADGSQRASRANLLAVRARRGRIWRIRPPRVAPAAPNKSKLHAHQRPHRAERGTRATRVGGVAVARPAGGDRGVDRDALDPAPAPWRSQKRAARQPEGSPGMYYNFPLLWRRETELVWWGLGRKQLPEGGISAAAK